MDLLPDNAQIASERQAMVRDDYETFIRRGLPGGLEQYLLTRYGLDVSTEYAGLPISNPWGKASGQLSMTARQVEEDVDAGLGFIVLKTVIAEDAAGRQSMQAWAIPESRMRAERITGGAGEPGWTISWKGRGWWQSFDDYLQLLRDARRLSAGRPTLVVPSCKFHLPAGDDETWRTEEYRHTVGCLRDVWREFDQTPMPLEKDFSPTLAGSDRASAQSQILAWLRTIPALIADAGGTTVAGRRAVVLGLKLFNAMFDEAFQLQMLQTIHSSDTLRPDFYIYANRLFDPHREFDGHRGIAYGGPDLSRRNLRVMSQFQESMAGGDPSAELLPWSATGDIHSGKLALEYALRGAGSFQLHTYFQLPGDQYRMQVGSKVEKALCELYFHPQHGFVVWMHHLATALELARQPIRFRDVIGRGRDLRRDRSW